LQLEKLGCPGETTITMVNGGFCTYSLGSQLAQAVSFLSTHHVTLVTIDIGGDNIVRCFTLTSIDQSCLATRSSITFSQLPSILAKLQRAAPNVPIYAMNYYDPFLRDWLEGSTGQVLARQSEQDIQSFNSSLDGIYANAGVPVANVQNAFQTTNFSFAAQSTLPQNVSSLCHFTWMCGPGPGTPSVHANDARYSLIAATFESVIGPTIH
jgi:hypothetical protein